MDGISLGGRSVTSDETIRKVIDLQAAMEKLRKENGALRRDRDDLLQEYESIKSARPITPFEHVDKPKTKGDTIRVSFGDMHGMRMDRQAVDALLGDIKRLAPDEIVLGGDMIEGGGFFAQHHVLGYVANCDYTYQEDIAATNWFLDELQKAAPKAMVYYLEGNHEDRIERWVVDETLGHARDAEFLLDLFGPQRLLMLDKRAICYVRRSQKMDPKLPFGWLRRGKMFYAHEVSGGKTAASKALAMTAGNITVFHTHQESSATLELVSVGLIKAFCPGCLCEKQPMWRHSNPTNWNHGYCIDVVAPSGNFQHIQVPIWEGESLGCAMLDRR
jgi:hypothetical protein